MPTDVVASVWYLKDPAQSLAYRKITFGPPTAAAVFPDDYEHIQDLTISIPNDEAASASLAAEIAWANCQNGRWKDPTWEPLTNGKRSMDVGDLVFVNDVAFRIMDIGVEQVTP